MARWRRAATHERMLDSTRQVRAARAMRPDCLACCIDPPCVSPSPFPICSHSAHVRARSRHCAALGSSRHSRATAESRAMPAALRSARLDACRCRRSTAAARHRSPRSARDFDPGDRYVLRADPVSLVAGRDDVVLGGAHRRSRRRRGRRAGRNAQRAFRARRPRIPRAAPDAWFVTPDDAPDLTTTPLSAVRGADLSAPAARRGRRDVAPLAARNADAAARAPGQRRARGTRARAGDGDLDFGRRPLDATSMRTGDGDLRGARPGRRRRARPRALARQCGARCRRQASRHCRRARRRARRARSRERRATRPMVERDWTRARRSPRSSAASLAIADAARRRQRRRRRVARATAHG